MDFIHWIVILMLGTSGPRTQYTLLYQRRPRLDYAPVTTMFYQKELVNIQHLFIVVLVLQLTLLLYSQQVAVLHPLSSHQQDVFSKSLQSLGKYLQIPTIL